MLKSRKLLSLLLALMLALGLMGLAGCGAEEPAEEPAAEPAAEAPAFTTITEGKIIVGSDTAYPPFENVVNGVTEGFDVDMMNAVGERLGVGVEFKTYKFDALIAGMQAGTEFDMIASAMTITDERKEAIDFSDPYINSNQSLAVAADSAVMTVDDLKSGDRVGVQSGTTGEKWATDNLAPKGIVVTPYDDILAAFNALSAGDIVGVINDAPISQDVVKDEARKAKVVAEIPTGEQYGFAFNKDNVALRDAVNGALAEIKTDGTYVEIYKKWFGAEPLSIP
ncbi:MAG: basic amino acid ABC transporter substrate-binding protein [Coriobacteriia bacterium]|nr:basic amino acid ABC transporter substrate-binding protein [Coriobacteriia bacterium]